MNILVCVKQVPNTKHMTIDPETHRLVRHGITSILNPSDRYVLERALRMRDLYGGKVTVISMGAPQAQEVLVSTWLVGGTELRLVSNQYLIGSNGKTIRPMIYFACGISGSLQHMTGVLDSGCIVAINRAPKAEIFQYADYCVVGDMFSIIPELQDLMENL